MLIQPLSEFELSEGRYNARDVLATCRLYKPLRDAIKATGTEKVYLVDRAMAKLALQMHRIGMPIDLEEQARVGNHLKSIRDNAINQVVEVALRPEFHQWIATFQAATVRKKDPKANEPDLFGNMETHEGAYAQRFEARKQELAKKWQKAIEKGDDPLNLKAKVQVAALLKTAGITLTRLSKNGVPRVGKEVLEEHARNPIAKALLDFGLTATVIATNIDGLELDEYGFLHPDWLIHKITGRWGSEPNVQNWSKRAGGGAENLRKMVKPPPGYTFIGADFAQLEARILACLSRDPMLLETFNRGLDIHAIMADTGFPRAWPALNQTFLQHKSIAPPDAGKCDCNPCGARDKLRDLTKRLEYGAWYGGQAETIHKAVQKDWPDLMVRDVENFIKNVSSRMRDVVLWRNKTYKDAYHAKEIRSPFLGRRQTFPLGQVDPTVAFNYKSQSGGADLWAMGALAFCQRFDQTKDVSEVPRIIHNGHDSVLVMTKKERASEVKEAVKSSWERTIDGVHFKLDIKEGASWAEV